MSVVYLGTIAALVVAIQTLAQLACWFLVRWYRRAGTLGTRAAEH